LRLLPRVEISPEATSASGEQGSVNSERRTAAVILLIALSAAIYLGNAGFPALLDDADASHAIVAREMLQRHDWVILYMNGVRYLMKAPLHYWVVAMSYAAFGQNEFSTRLPVALAMIVLVLLVNEFARRFFSARAGLYSGLVACTGAGFFLFTRIMIPEAIYALEFTAIFYLFLRGWTGSLNPRAAYGSAAALTGLAMLTRGLIGVIFPVAVLFLFIAATRSWNRWRELHLLSGAAIFFLVAAPWHILSGLRADTFFWSYFVNEHIKRAIGTRYPADYEAVPLWLWLGAHLIWFFPWSFFLPGVLRRIPRPQTWKKLSAQGQFQLLLVLWAGFILLFFSLTFGSRMEYYSFGAWPAIAMLLGAGLAKAEEQGERWVGRMQAALAGMGAALTALLMAMLWTSAKVHVNGDISSLLKEHDNNFYRVSMAHILDLTPQAFALLRLPSALAAAALVLGLGAAWWLRRKGSEQSAAICMAITMAAFFFAANMALGVFGPYLSSKPLLGKILPQITSADTLALYGEFDAMSGVAFYANRQLLLWNGRYNNLAAGSYYADAPHIFLTDPEFLALWQGPKHVLLFVPSEQRAAAAQRLPAAETFLLAESGGKAVYANRAATSVTASQ
jgi:4-amino-4-deoxy-L-arabinose transferase-like glycosyltransferase